MEKFLDRSERVEESGSPEGFSGARGTETAGKDSVAKRVLASAIFIPCLLVIARRGSYFFLALVDVMILIGLIEFYRMMEAKGLKPYKLIGILSGLVLSWYIFFQQGIYANFFLSIVLMAVIYF